MSLVEPEAHYSPTHDNLSVAYLKGNSNIKYDKNTNAYWYYKCGIYVNFPKSTNDTQYTQLKIASEYYQDIH